MSESEAPAGPPGSRALALRIASHLSGRELSAAEWDELWFWRAYQELHSAAGHRAKGEVEREREQLAFVQRMLDERPGALG